MSAFLLEISVGPVQDFIAAARSTRDFWFGSHVLSEISKAVARALALNGATLIFPNPETLSMLDPGSSLSVANRILAEAPATLNPAVLVETAKLAAQERWLGFAKSALDLVGESNISMNIWNEQVSDVIEFYAAWVPGIHDGASETSYRSARERLDLILAGRKALRDFLPAIGHARVPKSSLDGLRESVLPARTRSNRGLLKRLRIKPGEQLDVVGLVKRCAPLAEGTSFESVSRVAADTWVRTMAGSPQGRRILDSIKILCHPGFSGRVTATRYSDFPFEADVLFPSRLQAFLDDPETGPYQPALRSIRALVKDGEVSSPSPYYAILAADGDRIGAALSEMTSGNEHRLFSRCLSGFSLHARSIVETNHGCLVYSGGDDVLAFLPVETAVSTARELHDAFELHVQEAALGTDRRKPTLSVGIAIVHHLEPLGDSLHRVRAAEKEAKKGSGEQNERDGLAVCLYPRGGGAIGFRDQWVNKPDTRMVSWVQSFGQNEFPDRLAYEMHDLARIYDSWPEAPSELLRRDVERLLLRKRADNLPISDTVRDKLLDRVGLQPDLDLLAREMLVARHLAAISRQNGHISSKEGGRNL